MDGWFSNTQGFFHSTVGDVLLFTTIITHSQKSQIRLLTECQNVTFSIRVSLVSIRCEIELTKYNCFGFQNRWTLHYSHCWVKWNIHLTLCYRHNYLYLHLADEVWCGCEQILGSHRKRKTTQSNKQPVCSVAARGDSEPIVSTDSYMMQAERQTRKTTATERNARVCVCVRSHRQHVSLSAAP